MRWIMAVCSCLAWICMLSPASWATDGAGSAGGFRVLDISERTFDDGPAVAVLLSRPLARDIRHDAHLRISSPEAMLKSAWVLSDDGRTLYFPHVAPETEYEVTVLATLTSAEGDALGRRVTATVETRPVAAVASFASDGFLLPADTRAGLPVMSVNIPSVYVEFFRITDRGLAEFVNWRRMGGSRNAYTLSRADQYGELVFSGRFDLDVKKNRRTVSHLPVSGIDALQTPGVYLAVMREPGRYGYRYPSTYFLVTDIALASRVYATESLVFASSLADGTALADVSLSFLDKNGNVVASGVTDAAGAYRHDGRLPGEVRIITAERAGQVGVLPLDIPALDMSAFDLGRRPFRPREVFIYSPRDLYRPGETVAVSALLRDGDGAAVAERPLVARLFSPDGKAVRRMTLVPREGRLQGLGYYHAQIDLPANARTGGWELRVWDNPATANPAGVFAFHVEEFLPERMKLSLSAAPQFPGLETPLSVSVSGEYLYGAPAAGNAVAVRIRAKVQRNFPGEAFQEFVFGDIEEIAFRETWEITGLTLDEMGMAAIEIPSRWQEAGSPISVVTAVDLFESGGRPVTRAIAQTVWPADSIIGIRPSYGDGIPDPGDVGFDIVRVDRQGRMLPAQALSVEVVREERDGYWEYSESAGWRYERVQKNYRYLAEMVDLAPDRPTPITLPLESGQYVLAVLDPATGLKTSHRFVVGHGWYGGEEGIPRPDTVVMALDRPAYQPGDIIRLSVTPPHGGEGILLVEGRRPLWVRRMHFSAEGTVVEIPMLAGWRDHNIYISAVVFRPSDAAERITPNRAVGLLHLPLDRSRRKIGVSIAAPEKVVPQGPVEVAVTLDNLEESLGSPVFLTLSAVDVGILNITDFKTPDPWDYFFGRRRYGVEAYDVYGRVIESMEGRTAALRFGAGADLAGGHRPEPQVALVSLFQGPVAVDEAGRAQVALQLPNFNGRLRLMAVAFSRDAFGAADREMTVAAPVVAQLATPRFLAPGDRSEATLDVHNLSGSPLEISLTVSAEGPLALEEGARRLTMDDRGKTTLRFPMTAGEDVGPAVLRMTLSAGDYHFERRWRLNIRPGYPGISRRVMTVVPPGGEAGLAPAMAADFIPSTITGKLAVSRRVPIDFQDAMAGLIAYPYGCLEQTTSQAYPLLHATPEASLILHLPAVDPEKRMAELEKTFDRLGSMQLPTGGFGMWGRGSPEEGWLTVFAADFLEAAREVGLNPPEALRDSVLKRLEVYLERGAPPPVYLRNDRRDALDFAVRSYAGFVLARLGRAPLGALRTLYEDAGAEATPLALAHAGIALKLMGDAPRAEKALGRAVQARPDIQGFRPDYGSSVRDLAMTVALFIEHDAGDAPVLERLLSDLESALRARTWFSTQEKYALFRAGMALNGLSSGPLEGELIQGESHITVDRHEDFVTALGADTAATGTTFRSASAVPLYLSATLRGYTKNPPQPDASQIEITREYLNPDGTPLERPVFHVGELILVHLRLGAKASVPDALAADLVPAGFEVENLNLNTHDGLDAIEVEGRSIGEYRKAADVVYEEFREDRYVAALRLSEYAVSHLFYLVRAVSPGSFTVPPPFVEAMYQPEIRGIGEAGETVTIQNTAVPVSGPTAGKSEAGPG